MARIRCLALAMAVGIAGSSGCTVWQNARRTILSEPLAFAWKFDRQRSLKAYRSWAEQAWHDESAACPEPASEHYAFGFKDGFVDFVYAGGDGQPPPVPPRNYWNLAWRSPQGHTAADEWFAGYRHGAKVARAGGYRNLGIVYSSMRGGGRPAWSTPPMLAPPTLSEELGPPGELLPSPSTTSDIAPKANDASDAAPEVAAPQLGPPTDDAGAKADAAEPTTVPAPPAPPPSDDSAPPEKPESDDATHGAALQFRRAISAAASLMPVEPLGSAQPAGLAEPAEVSPAAHVPDAGPPAWPDPAIGAEAAATPITTEIVPASLTAEDPNAPLAPRPNVLRHPQQ